MNTKKTNMMIKRIITLFLILGAFVAQSFAQEKIYVWKKNGTAVSYNIAEIDSISFTAPTISTPLYETFTANLGGSTSNTGSYLSVSKKVTYTLVQAIENVGYVEIIFDGTQLKSPHLAVSADIASNGVITTFNNNYYYINITLGGKYSFETNNGLKGYISIDAVDGYGSATVISVTVETPK